MSNEQYREAQQAARTAGLQKRHEQRLENATYTAAEVKILTEAALRLGRKEAQDELEASVLAMPDGTYVLREHVLNLVRGLPSDPEEPK